MSTVENVRKYTQKLNVKNVSVNEFFRLEMLELFPTLLAKLLGLVFLFFKIIILTTHLNHKLKQQQSSQHLSSHKVTFLRNISKLLVSGRHFTSGRWFKKDQAKIHIFNKAAIMQKSHTKPLCKRFKSLNTFTQIQMSLKAS